MIAPACGLRLCAAAAAYVGLACAAGNGPPPDVAREQWGLLGGTPVEAAAWPNVVALDSDCTATLLAPDLLITAAHCASATRAFTGALVEVDPNAGFEAAAAGSGAAPSEHALSECVEHPGAEIGGGEDLAFCRLKEPIADVPIAIVAVGCARDTVRVGAALTLVGFGLENPASGAGIKRSVVATLEQSARELAIGDDGAGTCRGDSGGPAFARVPVAPDSSETSWQLIGVLSSGIAQQCGVGYYSDLARSMDWLERESGRDLTPCSDAFGRWEPSADCRAAPLDEAGRPHEGESTRLATCGVPFQPSSEGPDGCSVMQVTSRAHGAAPWLLCSIAAAFISRRRRLALAVLAASLGALLFFGVARPPADTKAEAAGGGATRENDAAATERAANGPPAPLQPAASRAVPQALTARAAAGAGAPSDGSAASPSSHLRSPRERLHATWQGEPLDPVWTAEAQELLSHSAAAVHVEVTLREEISCRQSLCRAVLEVAQPSDLRTLSQVTWGRPTVGFSVPGAGYRYEIYVARRQEELNALLDGSARP